jgi:hypothetical protein
MKLEMNRAWSHAMALVKANKDVVFVVAGVFFFLPYLVFLTAMPDMAAMGDPATADAAFEQMGAFYADAWWAMLLISIIQGVGMLGLLALLTDHRRPTVGQALKIGAGKILPYLAAYILLAMAVGMVAVLLIGGSAATGSVAVGLVGLLAAFALAAYAFVKFSLVAPVLVKEGVGNPVSALKRSWQLTKGNSLRLFAFYFLLLIAVFVLMAVISIVIGLLLALVGPDAEAFGSALLGSLMNAVWATVFLAVLAAVHDQLGGTSRAQISETFE